MVKIEIAVRALCALLSASIVFSTDGSRMTPGGGSRKLKGKGSSFQQYAFQRDLVRKAEERAELLQGKGVMGSLRGRNPDHTSSLSSLLLEKAVPLHEYNAKAHTGRLEPENGQKLHQFRHGDLNPPAFMSVHTGETPRSPFWVDERQLEDGGGDDDNANNEAGDDYYNVGDNLDFDGYSLKFAMCQKVQRFSSTAVSSGEYSALVTNDIVILRMCPQRRCKDETQYGCWSGYGEYALDVNDYLRIMIQYEIDKQKNLCGFCMACRYGNIDEYYGYDVTGGRKLGNGDDYYAGGDDQADDYYAGDDDSSGVCDDYADLCTNFGNWCNFDDEEENQNDDDDHPNLSGYLDFFDCAHVEGKDDYDYWVSPRCDPYSTSIKMAVFYDPYCSQYAGKEVNLNDVTDDFYFHSDIFEEFYSGQCLQCGKSEYPPYYNANYHMCNKMYEKSGKCNTYLAVDMNENDGDDDSVNQSQESTCSFIESLREGTYDASGQVDYRDSFSNSPDAVVTSSQKILLVASSLICVVLGVYSCYLHHEITNLLLKSLAHGHLIPGTISRSQSRGRSYSPGNKMTRTASKKDSKRRKGRSRSRRKRSTSSDEESDWD